MSNQNTIHVAVGVVYGADGRILVARRPEDKHQGGLWEFPGGKVEAGEDVRAALQRELKEELNIQGGHLQPLIQIRHNYPDCSVLLDTWQVSGILGSPRGNEGQPIQWVEPSELGSLNFPEANKSIINAIQLPDRYMTTGAFENDQILFDKVLRQVVNGVHLVQFRAPWLAPDVYLTLAARLSEQVRSAGGRLLVKGDPALLQEPWCDGLHLTSAQLLCDIHPKKQRPDQWLAASCHNEEELLKASAMSMDFVTLSPVKETTSHPGCEVLGMDQAARLTTLSSLPVYWLGGLSLGDIEVVRSSGAQGIGGIRVFW